MIKNILNIQSVVEIFLPAIFFFFVITLAIVVLKIIDRREKGL